MKALAVRVDNKPNEIKQSNWLVKDQEYTVVKLKRNVISNEQFFVLEEVTPDSPYAGYKINRFSYNKEDLENLINSKELVLEEY